LQGGTTTGHRFDIVVSGLANIREYSGTFVIQGRDDCSTLDSGSAADFLDRCRTGAVLILAAVGLQLAKESSRLTKTPELALGTDRFGLTSSLLPRPKINRVNAMRRRYM
jgi:hypothetical protein